MQVCHFFATTGCKFTGNCTKGSHDPSLVFPHLQSIVCQICVQHGQCTAQGCSKQHAPQVVNRYKEELAKQGRHTHARQAAAAPVQHRPASARPSAPSLSFTHAPKPAFSSSSTALVTQKQARPASARPSASSLSLVHAPKPAANTSSNALVTQMQGMGFAVQPGSATTQQVAVKQKRRRTNVVVALDLSGSMYGNNLDSAKRELNKLWNLLEKGDSLAIITFASDVVFAMTRRIKFQPKEGSAASKTPAHFDEKDLRAVVSSLQAAGRTALYDAVALAMQETQQAAEKNMRDHPNADWHTYQLLVITDGLDNSSKSANASSVNSTLLRPGGWAGKCHFSSCFVAIGPEAAAALAPCTAGLKHSLTVSDIEAGFRRLTETVADIRTTTVHTVKKSGFAFGGGVKGA